MSAESEHATWAFNLWWSNDEPLYRAVLAYARGCLRRVPNMTDQTLGLNVRNRVAAWCLGGGWGYDGQDVPAAIRRETLAQMAKEVGDFRLVDEVQVAESVLEALGIEQTIPKDQASAMAQWDEGGTW